MLLLVLALGAGPAAHPAACGKGDTISVSECGQALSKQADAGLTKYYKAALRKLQSEKSEKAKQSFIQAQRAWVTCRDNECKAIYEDWIDGSIRFAMQDGCIINLTKIRTFEIWRNWLTPMQGSPVLPRPDISSAVSYDGTR